jgi:hypothetical protein
MKTEKIHLRVSPEDIKNIQQATKKYHRETGAKENVSAMIRHVVKQYNASTGKVSETASKQP